MDDLINCLKGNEHNLLTLQIPKAELLVFVSSTFTDTHTERNILLDDILPALQRHGRPFGVGVNFIDMRYGVKNENTKEHLTWISCKHELFRCFHESGGLFFLSLQSCKYGYMPIPKHLSKHIFDQRMVNL